jgi:hypothetical protein
MKRIFMTLGLLAWGMAASASEITATPICGSVLPTNGVLATFKVGNESFRSFITQPTSINDAIALWRNPAARKRIPVGRLVCSPATWNCPWSFHQLPSSVTFAEMAIEVCDGTPSYVNQHCSTFGGGAFCPWSAVMAELRDCRVLNCPIVPR